MMRIIHTALLCCTLIGISFSQEPKHPFPQKVTYPYGYTPTRQDDLSNQAKQWYDSWKSQFLQECNGNLRPGVDPLSRSLVEAQGFAMVPVAYMGDKQTFDKLYNFYKSKCVSSACGLMDWKVTCSGVEAAGAATDGDVDVACALIVAHWQWPDAGYDEKARELISNLDQLVVTCGDLLALHPGCSGGRPWGGCNETDISYYAPAFFRYFAEISGDDKWNKLADDTHTIRDNGANSQTGLVPDWQSVEGRAGASGRNGTFAFDAIRAPYKQAMDFLWHGNEKSEAWCKKLTNWAHGIGVSNIKDSYNLNGTSTGSNHNMAVMGSMSVAAMANSQKILDDFVDDMLRIKTYYWYSSYLGNLYLFALSGNMWNPDMFEPDTEKTAASERGILPASNMKISVQSISGKRLAISGMHQGSRILLTSLTGRQVFLTNSSAGKVEIDISSLKRGCYILTVTSMNSIERKRRVVSVL